MAITTITITTIITIIIAIIIASYIIIIKYCLMVDLVDKLEI